MAGMGWVVGWVLLLAAAVLGVTAHEDAADVARRLEQCRAMRLPVEGCGGYGAGWKLGQVATALGAAVQGALFLLVAAVLGRLDRLAVPAAAAEPRGAEMVAPPVPEAARVESHAVTLQHIARLQGRPISAEEALRQARAALAQPGRGQ